MPSPIVVNIEVPAWMEKFIAAQSENRNAEVLHFGKRHEYNALLINLVENYRNTYPHAQPTPNNNSIVRIYLPFSNRKDVYSYNKLSEKSREAFRREVKADFLHEFKRQVRVDTLMGKQRKIAIEQFLDRYNIKENELRYDNLYRRYTRYLNYERLTI
jgi:hypothetical protein